MDETLRAETRQQALCDPLLKMQVNGVLSEHARVLEYNWSNGRFASPVGELLVLLARRTKSVEGGGPARIGLRTAIEPRECPDRPALIVSRFG